MQIPADFPDTREAWQKERDFDAAHYSSIPGSVTRCLVNLGFFPVSEEDAEQMVGHLAREVDWWRQQGVMMERQVQELSVEVKVQEDIIAALRRELDEEDES